jgi:hypothetical protein
MKLGDFVDRVCDRHGGYVREPKGGSLSGRIARGEVSLRFLARTDENGRRWAARIPPEMNAETELTGPVLRSLCNQLGIDPADFGTDEEPEDTS